MNNPNGDYSSSRRVVNTDAGLNRFMTKMYGHMTLSVLVSALTAFVCSFYTSSITMYLSQHSAMMWLLFLVPVGLSMGISFKATRNYAASFTMLMAMAVIYGFIFSIISLAYTSANIAAAFLSASAVFITMTVYGAFTKRDLTKFGSHARAALIALIIASVINIFLQSPAITYIFSYIAVIIFTVLTAYDTQNMKRMYLQYGSQVSVGGLAVMGALQLYLDFINIFISLLQIFGMGGSRD
ncbi:integral membrane protein [Paucilactobacillus oligofermentans DSM 15707 = LMG 22743]|uniref:Integral membrane protein n=1 Tax=Paucilactobacillus oligofermentans DSM 15707 = LMG 22743 TaxID=1423778 RepID=A0A0R1RRM5_9LACO|nr:Bax inhibitor-1/YccA family protein [Paucilactobacillus oligofermentans]KRL55971.1 integral membrane protein [Paucilactobacillus oligofermentans DSM 15707 = LMG 22743]CUS26047.1 BAX inhibitor (BI)-1/YccA-like membrane protein [Paucilactobacillus oligofermentans DSM 15707 = LMG 22743]